MKRLVRRGIVAVTVCALAAAPLAGCGSSSSDTSVTYDAQGKRFIVPSAYFGDKTESQCVSLLESMGGSDVVKQDDGSYMVTMSDEAYDAFVKDTLRSVESALDAIKGASSYPNITRVKYNDDLTEITLTTVKDSEVESDSEASALALYLAVMYQSIAGQDLGCTVTLAGPSGNTIGTLSYPTAN